MLQKSTSAVGLKAITVQGFPRDAAYVVVVVPCQLGSCFYVFFRKKRNPRKSWIVGIDEQVLNENVRVTRMLKKHNEKSDILGHLETLIDKID